MTECEGECTGHGETARRPLGDWVGLAGLDLLSTPWQLDPDACFSLKWWFWFTHVLIAGKNPEGYLPICIPRDPHTL